MLARMAVHLVSFQGERFADAWPEIAPLVPRHWAEIAPDEPPLDVDADGYREACADGRLLTVTARAGSELIGYAMYWVGPQLMRRGRKAAWADAIHVVPEHRIGRLGADLIAYVDRELAAMGVSEVIHMVRHPTDDGRGRDFGPVLRRLGYEATETAYRRRLAA